MDQEIRTSQALHTYGPGAIADFPELSVIVLSHDIPQSKNKVENGPYWGEDSGKPANKLEDDRLSLAFNVECFVSPPNSDSAHKAGFKLLDFQLYFSVLFQANCTMLENWKKTKDITQSRAQKGQ